MTLPDLQGIRQRLQQTIESLEKQTQSLRQDLQVIDAILTQSANPTQEQPQAAAPAQPTAPKTPPETSSEVSPETDSRSELEKATIALLERMQKKVYAQEILGDLYGQMANNPPAKSPQASPDMPSPMAEAQLEQTVQQIKQKDALNELKKKMGLK